MLSIGSSIVSGNLYKTLFCPNEMNAGGIASVPHSFLSKTGIFYLGHDYEPIAFKNNVLATAACAKFFKLPTILTTSKNYKG